MRVRLTSFFLIILFLLSILETFFFADALRYYDECLMIVCTIYVFAKLFTGYRTSRLEKNITIIISALLIAGLCSNLLFNVQNSYTDVLIDIMTFAKPFSVFLACAFILKKRSIYLDFYKAVVLIARILIYVMFFSLVLGMVLDTPFSYYDKWAVVKNVKTYTFLIGYPSIAAGCIIPLMVILNLENNKKNRICLIMSLIMLVFTQSGIGILGAFVFLILKFFFQHNKKIRWWHIALIVLGGTFVGYTEIREYLLNASSARSLLFQYAFKTANTYFPLGSGFATYGSSQAAKSYSELYLNYGFTKYWGMGIGDNSFYLHDSYFPMLIGQFGYIGSFLYFVFYKKFFSEITRLNSVNTKCAMLLGFIMMLALNLGQGGFSSTTGVMLMIGFAVTFRFDKSLQNI